MIKRKIIVIGGSAAGPAASAKAKRVNPQNEVVLYEAGNYISIGTCELPYVLTGEIENLEKIIFFTPESFEKEKGVKVFVRHRVESIDRVKKRIYVRDLNTQKVFEDYYDKLILCTGSIKKIHSEFKQNLDNVFYLKTVDDAKSILNFVSKNNITSSLLIGTGYTGLEVLEFLKKISNRVYATDIAELPLTGFDLEFRKIVLDKMNELNINFLPAGNYIKVIAKDNKVTHIMVNKEKIDVDLVLISIGVKPENSLAQQCGLSMNFPSDSIKVDDKQKTSDDNIYAAGDCSGVKEFITKKQIWLPLSTLAYNSGHVAGANAAGENISTLPVVRNMVFKFFDINFALVGLNMPELNDLTLNKVSVSTIGSSKINIMPNGEKHFIKLYYKKDDGKILSAQFVGGEDIVGKANLISFAIRNNISIQKLYETNYAYTPSLSPFIDSLSIISKKSRD